MIYFRKTVQQGAYNPETGDYADSTGEEVGRLAAVSATSIETMRAVFGEVRDRQRPVPRGLPVSPAENRRLRTGEVRGGILMKVKLEGLTALTQGLNKRADLSEVKAIVMKNGDQLNRRMKRQTTASFKKGYTTGQTARSINTEIYDGGLTAVVEPGTHYSPYVEYGTRFMKAEPFVRPAFEEQAQIFCNDLDALVR